MRVSIWFRLYWVFFSFFDHHIQSSVQFEHRFLKVQFSTVYLVPPFLEHLCTCVTLDARVCLAWTLLGIISFLRSLYSKYIQSSLIRSGESGSSIVCPVVVSCVR